MKNKIPKPISSEPMSPKTILKRLELRLKASKHRSVKAPYHKKYKVLRRLRKKLAIKSIRRNR
jgi:hypothetical protein